MKPIPVRLPTELQARVDSLAREMSISRSAVLRLAIQQWLDAAEKHGTNPLTCHEKTKRRGEGSLLRGDESI